MTNYTMQSAGDTDWLKLELTAGKTYAIKTTGLDDYASYDIVDQAAASDSPVTVDLSKGTEQDYTIIFTADTTGAYEFSTSDSSGLTGAYAVAVTTAANAYTLAAGKTLAVNGSDKAAMQSAGDTDWFKIDLTKGKTYTFKTTGLDDLAAYEIVAAAKAVDSPVYDESSTGSAAPAEITFTADASGAYEFKVYDISGLTGAYTVSDAVVTNTYALANDVTLAAGATDKATMQSAGDTDWFEIHLTKGTTYSFTTAGLSAAAQISLVPAAEASDQGLRVGESDYSIVQDTFTADTSGAYEVSVYDSTGKTGAYTVSDKIVANTYTLAKDVTLAVNATDKASVQSVGDTDWFKINLVAGKTYTFTTTGLDESSQFEIAPVGEALDSPLADFGYKSPNSNGVFTYTADTTGAYEASINEYSGQTGAYTLSDKVVANTYALADGVTLAVGGTDKARIQSAGDTDWFKIDLTKGKTYTFTITGLDDEAQYNLYPMSGAVDFRVIASSAKSTAVTHEFTFTADTTGPYELAVFDTTALTGAYTVSDAVVTDTYTLAAGVTVPAGATRATAAPAAPFVHAMAGFGAGGGAVQEGLATGAGSGTPIARLVAGMHGTAPNRIGTSWA